MAHGYQLLLTLPVLAGQILAAQSAVTEERLSITSPERILTLQNQLRRFSCPGDPAANLGSFDCSFTKRQRLQDFIGGYVSDQAIVSATFFGAIAEIQNDPSSWHRNWEGFGYRVGSRYAQTVAKGAAQFTAGAILRTDPRHIRYADDPGSSRRFPAGKDRCQVLQEEAKGGSMSTTTVKVANGGVPARIGHVFLDWLTVRQSSPCGAGRRIPNIPLFAGAAASGFIGNAWYPDPQATPQQAAIRAANSLSTALAFGFYSEFSPEIGRVLGALFKRGATPKMASNKTSGRTAAAVTGGAQ